MEDSRAIGVFDSGIGGLTVLKELLYQFPNESFVYLGDTARLPYGSKSPETIRKYSEQNLRFLISQDVKALVIACNSASAQMPESDFSKLPLYNVIDPGTEEAIKNSSSLRIGVLGTRATVESKAYEMRIKALRPEAQVFSQACPLFVPLAEEGWVDDPITNLIVYRYVYQVLQQSIDTLVLGCTHYPILKNSIARVTGPEMKLIDSGEAVAHRLQSDLKSQRIQASGHRDFLKILVTDGSEHFLNLAKRLLTPFTIDQFEIVNLDSSLKSSENAEL